MKSTAVTTALSLLLAVQAASADPVAAGAAPASKSWTLYHSFDGGRQFTRRGVIDWDTEKQELDVRNDDACLSTANLDQAKKVGWYQVKLVPENAGADVKAKAADDSTNFAMATVPTCHIQRAGFRDEFGLMIARDDSLLSMTYSPLISPLAPKDCAEMDQPEDGDIAFVSKASLELDRPGMTIRPVLPQSKPPPGMNFVKSPNSRTGAGPEGANLPPNEPEPITGPTGFIKRYWYIVLPLVLANFIGGEEPPPEGQQQQQQEQQGAQGNAPAAGAAQQSKRARRGKRN